MCFPQQCGFAVVNPAVNLCEFVLLFVSLWQQSIKSRTQDCDLSAESRGRGAKLQRGTVLTRHKSPAVLAEKLNSIGQINWFLCKYSLFQICDDRKTFIHLTSLPVQLFCEKYQTLEQGKQCFVFNNKNMNRACSVSHISLKLFNLDLGKHLSWIRAKTFCSP